MRKLGCDGMNAAVGTKLCVGTYGCAGTDTGTDTGTGRGATGGSTASPLAMKDDGLNSSSFARLKLKLLRFGVTDGVASAEPLSLSLPVSAAGGCAALSSVVVVVEVVVAGVGVPEVVVLVVSVVVAGVGALEVAAVVVLFVVSGVVDVGVARVVVATGRAAATGWGEGVVAGAVFGAVVSNTTCCVGFGAVESEAGCGGCGGVAVERTESGSNFLTGDEG